MNSSWHIVNLQKPATIFIINLISQHLLSTTDYSAVP